MSEIKEGRGWGFIYYEVAVGEKEGGGVIMLNTDHRTRTRTYFLPSITINYQIINTF